MASLSFLSMWHSFYSLKYYSLTTRVGRFSHPVTSTPTHTCMCAYTFISYLFHCRQMTGTISAFIHFFTLHRFIENPDIGLRFRDIFEEKF